MLRGVRSIWGSLKLTVVIAGGVISLLARRPRTPSQRAAWLHRFCLRLIRAAGVRLTQHVDFPAGGVIIANHIGYLDIAAFAALHHCVFVSKSEIADWPVIGWITTQAGTVYVERGRGGSAERAKAGFEVAAADNVPVVFFPEGTTSDGSDILPFRSGLIADCISAGQPITVARVSYRSAAGETANRLAYWDDTPFLLHIFRLLGEENIEVEIAFAAAPIVFSKAALEDRHIAAEEARRAMLALPS